MSHWSLRRFDGLVSSCSLVLDIPALLLVFSAPFPSVIIIIIIIVIVV